MERLQFTVMSNDFIHPSQLGGLKFKSTTNAGVALIYIIRLGWVKNKTTSTLAFDISQFFLLFNYQLLTLILEKVELKPKVTSFFVNYLAKRKTSYLWNGLPSPTFKVNIGVGQGSALSPILLVLYLSPFYICSKIVLKTLIFQFLSFHL